jgi:putative ABC transport system substrate-binding protein
MRTSPNYEVWRPELIAQNCDVIVTASTPAVQAVKLETTTIPVVMASIGGDPVASGLVSSLSRPGGNITGTTYIDADVGGKRIELLKEVFPRIKRVALLLNPQGRVAAATDAMNRTANGLKLVLRTLKCEDVKTSSKRFWR